MQIKDSIEPHNMYFVEQDLDRVVLYEIYRNNKKIYQSKNYDDALQTWCWEVSRTKV